MKISPFLKLYSVYVSNYDAALSLVMELRKQSQPFVTFLNERFQMPECRSLTFEAFLILPIQRIPRYKMLFQDLLKHTPESHVDYKNLERAFQVIAQVANFVNQTIKDQEGIEKIFAIQNSLSGLQESLMVPGRKFIREGTLMKVCRKGNKPRIFFLFSDILIYGTTNSVGSHTFHRSMPIDTMMVSAKEDTEDIRNCFFIVSSNKSFKVFAETPEDQEAWMKAISEQIEAKRKNQSTLRVNGDPSNTFLAPVWLPDGDVSNCMICDSEFTLMKRRHHCRYCGKIFCGSCCPKRFAITLLPSFVQKSGQAKHQSNPQPNILSPEMQPGSQKAPSEFVNIAILPSRPWARSP